MNKSEIVSARSKENFASKIAHKRSVTFALMARCLYFSPVWSLARATPRVQFTLKSRGKPKGGKRLLTRHIPPVG